jgi:hypothetical protein
MFGYLALSFTDPHKPRRDMDMSDEDERVLKTEVLAFMIQNRNELFQVSDLVSAGKSRRRCRVPFLAKQAICRAAAEEQSVKELGLWEYRVKQMLSANQRKVEATRSEGSEGKVGDEESGGCDEVEGEDLSDEEEETRLAAEAQSKDGSSAVLASIRDEEADVFMDELSSIARKRTQGHDAAEQRTTDSDDAIETKFQD